MKLGYIKYMISDDEDGTRPRTLRATVHKHKRRECDKCERA